MIILGIETSCDETSAGLVCSDGRVLSNVVSSQIDIHSKFGGVVPELASRKHVQAILPVIDEALSNASIKVTEIDGISVTQGPGLIGALMIGVTSASAMGWALNLPVVGVSHLRGHIMSVFLYRGSGRRDEEKYPQPPFPFVGLVASGGHTSLFFVESEEKITLIGRTRDDAAGEALDKGAKILGLGYPGGPEIERCAGMWNGKSSLRFPRGLGRAKTLDFSFSGVKTALMMHIKDMKPEEVILRRNEICSSYQMAIVDAIVSKAVRACKKLNSKTLVATGGVLCNSILRRELIIRSEEEKISLFIPPHEFCTDNGAMIAIAGRKKLDSGVNELGYIKATPWLETIT